MPNFNQPIKQKIIFPENTDLIISNILEKHGLAEAKEEVLGKLEADKKINGEIIIALIVRVAQEKISLQESANLLKKELGISSQKAKDLANDLQKEILLFVKKTPEEIPSPPSQKPAEEKPPLSEEDIYREPIE